MRVENGKFSIQVSTDFGVVKSTNAKKELKYRLARKEKEKKQKNSKDLRQELQMLSEKKKEKFMELFSKPAKKRKKSGDEIEVEFEDKTKVQKLTRLEDKKCYNTTKTNVLDKTTSIPGGKISKLRNIFESKADIAEIGGVSSMKPSLAKEIANGSPAASKGKEENLGFSPLEGIGEQQGPDKPIVNNQ